MDTIISKWRIDWDPDGLNIRLLDFGDELAAQLVFGWDSQTGAFNSAGAVWGGATADGGARRSISYLRILPHASHPLLRNHCLMHDSVLPIGAVAKVRVAALDGVTVDYAETTLQSGDATAPTDMGDISSATSYKLSCGKMTLVAGLPFAPGLIWDWILPNWEDLDTHNWEDM